ncbi:restriction endonuclease subunit S [Micromonospora sp. NPDC049151]|uniref:restriction endonuclease subunit S n=1 Tax=Micromonospora sp. NPDC049151 TaxID=3155648 RepID=UPI0033C13422
MTDLPAGWTTARLGELVEINPRKFDQQPVDDEQISLLPMAAVEAETGHIDASREAFYGDAKRRSLTPVQEGDVLFAKVTPCMENGKVAVARNLKNGRALGSTELFALRSRGAIDPTFLCYYLLQHSVRVRAQAAMAGAVGLRRVPRRYLEDLILPVPPLAEQRRIVEVLDLYLGSVSSARERLVSVKRKLAGRRQAVARAAMRGLLSIKAEPNDSGVDLVIKIGGREAIVDDGDWPLPRSWAWSTIGSLFRVFVGSTPSRSRSEFWGGGIPWVSSGEVSFTRIERTKETVSAEGLGNLRSRLHPPGTVLLAMIGEGKTRGQAAILDVEAAHNQNCASIRVSETPILPEFVYMFWLSRYVETRRAAAGGNQLALNRAAIRAVKMPVPPLGVQRRAVEIFEDVIAEEQRLMPIIDSAMKKASGLRGALMAEAFSGRLVAQDQTEQPAAELIDCTIVNRSMRPLRQRSHAVNAQKEPVSPPVSVTGGGFEQEALPW